MVGIGKVDNNNLILFVDLFRDTNEVVGLQGQNLEATFLATRSDIFRRWLQRLT